MFKFQSFTTQTRKSLMNLLGERFPTIPPNFRIHLTGRAERDIISLKSLPNIRTVELGRNTSNNKQDILTFNEYEFEFDALRMSQKLLVPNDYHRCPI